MLNCLRRHNTTPPVPTEPVFWHARTAHGFTWHAVEQTVENQTSVTRNFTALCGSEVLDFGSRPDPEPLTRAAVADYVARSHPGMRMCGTCAETFNEVAPHVA